MFSMFVFMFASVKNIGVWRIMEFCGLRVELSPNKWLWVKGVTSPLMLLGKDELEKIIIT